MMTAVVNLAGEAGPSVPVRYYTTYSVDREYSFTIAEEYPYPNLVAHQ